MPPAIQTNYADNISNAYPGAIANTERGNLISRTVEDSGGIAFGLAVMQGTEDKGITVSDGTSFLGVTVRTQDRDPDAPNAFAYQESARIMNKGVIWVANSGGVNAGDNVEALADGALGSSTDGNVPGARWETSAEDGELAQLRLA